MDSLLAKLSEQQAVLEKQKTSLPSPEDNENQPKEASSPSSTLLTPASDSFSPSTVTDIGKDTVQLEAAELLRLKKELDDAKEQIARQKQELDQSRVIKHTFDQAVGPPSETALSPKVDATGRHNEFAIFSNRPFGTAQGPWPNEDARSDGSDAAGTINTAANIWSGSSRPGFNAGLHPDTTWGQPGPRPWGQRAVGNPLPPVIMAQQAPMQQRNYSVPVSPSSNGRVMSDFGQFNQGRGFGNLNAQNNRNAPPFQRGNGWEVYPGGPGPMDGMNLGGMNPGSAYPSLGIYPSAYQPQPIGTPLSPTAAEFRGGQASANPWNSAVSQPKPCEYQTCSRIGSPNESRANLLQNISPPFYNSFFRRGADKR